MADDTLTVAHLTERVMRHFDDGDSTLAQMTADVDALIAAVRAEQTQTIETAYAEQLRERHDANRLGNTATAARHDYAAKVLGDLRLS